MTRKRWWVEQDNARKGLYRADEVEDEREAFDLADELAENEDVIVRVRHGDVILRVYNEPDEDPDNIWRGAEYPFAKNY